jgi:hypothetical protein
VNLRRTPRRLASAVAALAAGIVGALVVASPAQAHHSDVVGETECDTATGQWKVHWTVTGYAPYGVQQWWLKDEKATHGVSGSTVTDSNPIPTGSGNAKSTSQTFTGTQTVPGNASWAELQVKAKWSNGFTEGTFRTGKVNFTDTCEPNKPAPTATFTSNCDGTVTVTLRNDDGKADAVFQINGGADITVAPNAKPDPITVQPVNGKVTVTSGGQPVGDPFTWTPPDDCAPAAIASKSDCTSLTVELTNPQGGTPTSYKVRFGSTEETGTLAVNEAKTFGPFQAGPGNAAEVTVGNSDPVTVNWAPDPQDCTTPTTTTTTPELPDTGTGGLGGIVVTGAALVLGGAGLLTLLFLRRRRSATN